MIRIFEKTEMISREIENSRKFAETAAGNLFRRDERDKGTACITEE